MNKYPNATLINSGNGFHIYYRIRAISISNKNRDNVDLKRTQLMKHFQRKFGTKNVKIDSVQDLPRIMRVAGTVSHKDSKNLLLSKIIKFSDEIVKLPKVKIEEYSKRYKDCG